MKSFTSTLIYSPRLRTRIVNACREYTVNTSPGATNPSPLGGLQDALKKALTSRRREKTRSAIDPTPSHLLNLTLADFLPSSCHAPPVSFFTGHDNITQDSLPQGHHLVYFPPLVPNRELLSDGTDTLHSPGAPFVRRLWAGGSIIFHPQEKYELNFMKGTSTCLEDIEDVRVKGVEGDEKVFVKIRRRMRGNHTRFIKPNTMDAKDAEVEGKDNGIGRWSVQEHRDLVFMREKSKEDAKKDIEKQEKVVKPNLAPDFSVSLTPTPELLFRWSALTFNAHRIHLDPQYCQQVEGHRNMLVHGPLSLVLMLSVLRSQLKQGEMIMRLDYRNLAPLYVSETMKVCLKEREKKGAHKSLDINSNTSREFDVWIEGKQGGYAVKGTSTIGMKIPSETTLVQNNPKRPVWWRKGVKKSPRKEEQSSRSS